MTAAPLDTSFSSHSDDYESSREIDDIDENQLSSSLLYCLDGNRPDSENSHDNNDETSTETHDEDADAQELLNDTIDNDTTADAVFENRPAKMENSTTTATSSTQKTLTPLHNIRTSNRLATNPFVILNNARKRAATNDLEKMTSLLFNSQNSPSCQGFNTYITTTNTIPITSRIAISNKNNSLSSATSANKENFEHTERNYVANKKIMISGGEEEEYPGETSF